MALNECDSDAGTVTDVIKVVRIGSEQSTHAAQRARDAPCHGAAITVEVIFDRAACGYTVSGRNLRDRYAEELDHIPQRRIRRLYRG